MSGRCASSTARSTPPACRGQNVQALRAQGRRREARRLRALQAPPRGGLVARPPRRRSSRRQLVQWRALARLLPRTDVFHFYFGLTLVPKSLQFPILRATRKKSVFHFLGSDIRGKTPEELAYGKRAGAQIVGSYDAARWVPEAEVVPPGIDLRAYAPVPPSDRERPVVLHAPSSRRRKGTEHVDRRRARGCRPSSRSSRACTTTRRGGATSAPTSSSTSSTPAGTGCSRSRRWRSASRSSRSSTTRPSRRTEEAFGLEVPIVRATKETLADVLRPLVDSPEERRRDRRREPRLRRARARHRPRRRPPARHLRSALDARSRQLKRLGRHSVIYGLGGIVSRDPRGPPAAALHALPTPRGYGQIESSSAADGGARDRAADGDLERVLPLLLRLEGRGAPDARRPHVASGSRWRWRPLGLVVGLVFADADRARCSSSATTPWLVRAAFVGLWAQMNYEQLTVALPRRGALRRVRDREPRERPDHGRRDRAARRRPRTRARSASIVGNFIGTLCVYFVLLALPPLPARPPVRPAAAAGDEPVRDAARPVGARALGDQLHRPPLRRPATRARPRSASTRSAVRIASAIVFLMIAFRTAWPAFAYSIEDDREARRTYAFVLTYLLFVCSLGLARARRARAVARPPARARTRLPRARRRASRCSRSRAPRTRATPCSRSASAARGGRSSTGS